MPIFKHAQEYLAPIMAERPEARPCRSGIVFAHAKYIFKGLFIWRGGNAPAVLKPQWEAGLLATPARIPASLSCDIYPERDTDIQWLTTYPNVIEHLNDHFRRHALPVLDALETIDDIKRKGDDLVAQLDRGRGYPSAVGFHAFADWRVQENICLHAINGEFDAALELFEAYMSPHRRFPVLPQAYLPMVNDLFPALHRRDIPGIARVLHEWETQNAHFLKITKHWRPTPFDWE